MACGPFEKQTLAWIEGHPLNCEMVCIFLSPSEQSGVSLVPEEVPFILV